MLAAKEAMLHKGRPAGWDLTQREDKLLIESVSSAGCNIPGECTR